jgi:hypothetical protein
MALHKTPSDEPDTPLAPILSLCEARRRRRRLPLPVSAPDPHAQQRDILEWALRSRRLLPADLFAMIRLGIMTDSAELLPCADPHRRENAHDWEQRYLGLASGAAPLPRPSQVSCPLMAHAASAHPPACVEALRVQTRLPVWQPEQGFVPRPADADLPDPILVSELRPCLILGRELLLRLLLPLYQHEEPPSP